MSDTNQGDQSVGITNRAWGHVMLLVVAGGWLAADQVTKRLAAIHLAEHASGLFETSRLAARLSLAHNPAGAWSMFGWAPGTPRRIMFIAVSVVASAMLGIWYARTQASQRLLRVGIACVLGGALGNLVDRALTGQVIDFMEVSAIWGGGRHYWPTFNVADVAISVGVALMAIDMVRGHKPPPQV